MALRLVAASKTDVGKQREQNEDSCYTQIVEDENQASGLFVVADGMGGYHAGEIASRIAVETISETLGPVLGPQSSQPTLRLKETGKRGRGRGRSSPANDKSANDKSANDKSAHARAADAQAANEKAADAQAAPAARPAAETQELSESLALEHYATQLRDAIQLSSKAVVDYGNEHKEARGMGSTVTTVLIVQGQAFIANVGDSRTYLLREGKLQRVTQDHSLVERLVEAGQIAREDVYDHPSRNLVYRSLGAGRAEVEVDIFTERLQPGDALLLCSDGLWEMVRDAQLESILAEVADPAEACDLLIERANENGGEDNITAVLVRCQAG